VFLDHQAKVGILSLYIREGDNSNSYVRDIVQEGLPLY
jgi:hypothetical protein